MQLTALRAVADTERSAVKAARRQQVRLRETQLPMTHIGPGSASAIFGQLGLRRHQIVTAVQNNLSGRGVAPRSPADDALFVPFNNFIAVAINRGLQRFCIDLFRELDALVAAHEHDSGTIVHKGALFFNVALCYLWSGDYDFASYYFSAAAGEDELTYPTQPNQFYFGPLYTTNFMGIIRDHAVSEAQQEGNICQLLFGSAFAWPDVETFLKTWGPAELINFLVNMDKFVRYQLFSRNQSAALLAYRLVDDCCLMFETALKSYLKVKNLVPEDTLGGIRGGQLQACVAGNITQERNNIKQNCYPCASIADYKQHLQPAMAQMRQEGNRTRLAALLLHVIYMTRNQVSHSIDPNNVIYGNLKLCNDLVRLILIALQFPKYLL